MQVTDGLLAKRVDQCASFLLTGLYALQADSMLLGRTSCVLVAVLAQQLQLIVYKFGRSNLDWVLRLEFVGGWVIRKPKRGLSMGRSRLVQNLLLLLGQHDDLLLALWLRRSSARDGGPGLRVQKGLALKHL